MSAATRTTTVPVDEPTTGRRASFIDTVASEWIKFRTLRSTVYTLLALVVIGVGFGAFISYGGIEQYREMTPHDRPSFDPTNSSLTCYMLAQLAIAVLGVLVVTSEYATGMIRTSLTAVPPRGRLLAAKATVFAAIALVAGQVVGFGAFLVGQPVLAAGDVPHAALGDPHVLRAVIGCGLYLTLVGLLGVALGVLVRATAGALTIVVAVALVVPLVSGLLPGSVQKFWPITAGAQVMTTVQDPDMFTPWGGFGILCATVAALMAAAFVVFRTRDA